MYLNIFSDELELVENAAKKTNLISQISAPLNMPNFTELQNMKNTDHIILYLCDLWGYISSNVKDRNIQDFLSFLLKSRRLSCSIIFEFHGFPFGLQKDVNALFSLYLANSTLIFLTKSFSDKSKINHFKRRYLSNNIAEFENAESISQHIVDGSQNKQERVYVCLQKDHSQKYRLLRVDIFDQNIILFLD